MFSGIVRCYSDSEIVLNMVISNVNKHRKFFASWQEVGLSYLENLFSFYKEDIVLLHSDISSTLAEDESYSTMFSL